MEEEDRTEEKHQHGAEAAPVGAGNETDLVVADPENQGGHGRSTADATDAILEDGDTTADGGAGSTPAEVEDARAEGEGGEVQPEGDAEPAPIPFDIFAFVRNIKCPPLQKEVITHFDEAAAANPHQILRGIFTFLRSRGRPHAPARDGDVPADDEERRRRQQQEEEEGPSEADKILVLSMGHELLFAYFDDQVEPPSEEEQQLALEALKTVYQSSQGESMTYRRELNNVVSLIWKLSDEIDIDGSDRQVDNFAQLLRYCLNTNTHTAANTQEERYQLQELGLTLFLRVMHELLLPYLLAHEEGEDDEGPAHIVEKHLFPHLSTTLTDSSAPLSLRVAAAMVITNAFNSELPSCLNGFATMNSLVPHILQTIPELYRSGDFEKLEELLRSFDNLSLHFLLNHMPLYAQTLVCLATTPLVPGRLRSVALQPLVNLSGKYASVLSTDINFLRFLIRHLMYMFLLAEPRMEEEEIEADNERPHDEQSPYYDDETANNDEDDEEQQQKDSPVAVAGWALSAFISSFGHGVMVPMCLEYVGQFFMCQDVWQYPHAALRALAALMKAYGRVAPESKLDPLVYTVLYYYQHSNISLRVAAAICLGRMAKHVPRFAQKFSTLIFPIFNDRLKDKSVSVLITTCRAMTYFFINKSKDRSSEFKSYDEEDNDEADAEDHEQEVEEEQQFIEMSESQPEEKEALPPPLQIPKVSAEEDVWSDKLVQGLSLLVKGGSVKVKEHAVTALFNITQLSTSVLMKHLPQLVSLCLDMLNQKLTNNKEVSNLRTIGRVLRCTTQIGVVAGKTQFQPDALKFLEALINPNDTVERLLQGAPSYLASALGRIAICLQMDFAPYLGLFFNVMERSISAECDNALLMTEDRPVDLDGWEVAESVDDFGGVQKVYVYKREIRDKRIAVNSLGSVIGMFAESAEGSRHFLPYIMRAQCLLLRILRLVDNNFEVMGVKELHFSKCIPALIQIYTRVASSAQTELYNQKKMSLKASIAAAARAARNLSQETVSDAASASVLAQAPLDFDIIVDKGKEKEYYAPADSTEAESDKANDVDVSQVKLVDLVEPLWQDLANAYERAHEPKKSIDLLGLWNAILEAANGPCLSPAEVHTTSEHIFAVLYDCDHYMYLESDPVTSETLDNRALSLSSDLIPNVLEGLLKHHPEAYDSAYILQHIIPTLTHDLDATAFTATQLGCLLMLDSVLDFIPQPETYVAAICPLLFRFVSHSDAAIAQAACYGLGVCANLITPETDKATSDAICQHFPSLSAATYKWLSRAQSAREDGGTAQIPEQWACDNMLSAQAKIFRKHFYNMPNLTGSIDAWLQCLPLRIDTMEMAEVITILCDFIRSDNANVRMFIASRNTTVARALTAQLIKLSRRAKKVEHMEKVDALLPFINSYLQQVLGDVPSTPASSSSSGAGTRHIS